MSTPINVLEVFQKFFWLASGIDTWLKKKKEKPIENVKKRLYEPTVQIILYIYICIFLKLNITMGKVG